MLKKKVCPRDLSDGQTCTCLGSEEDCDRSARNWFINREKIRWWCCERGTKVTNWKIEVSGESNKIGVLYWRLLSFLYTKLVAKLQCHSDEPRFDSMSSLLLLQSAKTTYQVYYYPWNRQLSCIIDTQASLPNLHGEVWGG